MGMFGNSLVTTYRAEIEFKEKIIGGVPKDPTIIEGWLRTKTLISDEQELKNVMLRTMEELGLSLDGADTEEALKQVSEEVAKEKQSNGFKRNADGLYIENRQVKAMLRECVNILFAGERWGPTKKGPKSYFAERVFVNPSKISLGVQEPTGVEILIGHISGKDGVRSTLTYAEYVEQPRITFDILVTNDVIRPEWWSDLWQQCELIGLGAARSQSFGQFDIWKFDKIRENQVIDFPIEEVAATAAV